MTALYRLVTSTNGLNFIEDYELSVLEGIRSGAGKTKEEWPIIPLEIKFQITNDPERRQFDDYDLAQETATNLANDTFQVGFTKTLIDPPPEGFEG